MQVIGLCRFSYPAIGGFQISHESPAERRAYLYSEARMEERFRLFETMTLPSLKAQSDGDFTLLVVVGDSLPARYRHRLDDLLADLPQAVVQAWAPGRHRRTMQRAINAVRRTGPDPCLQFRMDDDDAVALSFVARLRKVAADVAGLVREQGQIAIDFNQGYVARPGRDGLAVERSTRPFMTAGLGFLIGADNPLCAMNFAHAKLARTMPTIAVPGEDMFVRGHGQFNDSRQKPGAITVRLKPLDAAGEAHFRATFNIDADHVRRVFSDR